VAALDHIQAINRAVFNEELDYREQERRIDRGAEAGEQVAGCRISGRRSKSESLSGGRRLELAYGRLQFLGATDEIGQKLLINVYCP
jgi:hypothetical protein